MEIEDFFSFQDFFRTIFIASSLFLIVGTFYGVFLHALYSSQVSNVKNDLIDIEKALDLQARSATLQDLGSQEARQYRDVSRQAGKLAKQVNPPEITPTSYTYFNYWISSAAFTAPRLTDEAMGLSEETREAFTELDDGMVFGESGWWNRTHFRVHSERAGRTMQLLKGKPRMETHFWTFYFFVLAIAMATAYIGIKESYELPALPEALYGIFMPVPFFVILSFTSLLSVIGIDFVKTDMNFMALILSFVIMSMISAIGSLAAVSIRSKIKAWRE
jgi:hypothetical protein